MLAVVPVQLYHLREVGLPREHILDSATVEHEAVSRKLEALFFRYAVTQIGKGLIRVSRSRRPTAYEGINLLSASIATNPSIPVFAGVFDFDVALFLTDETPNFRA